MTDILLKELRILIIGGGPSGLAIARLLQLNGFNNVCVAERDQDRNVRVGGSSLDLHESTGLKFIKKANLLKEFNELSRPEGESITIVDKNCNVLLWKPHLKVNSKKPEIDRGVLRNMLLDSLEPNTIEYGLHFISLIENQDKTTTIHFKNGVTKTVDLVIGSDGANSKVRKYVNDIKLVYSGITLLEFEVSKPMEKVKEIVSLVDSGLFYALDDEKGFIIQMKGDGNLIVYLSCKRPENWIGEQRVFDLNDFKGIQNFIKQEVIADWDDKFKVVVDNAIKELSFIPRPIYSIPLDPMIEWHSKSVNNITLIGDAAHTIVPYAGKGLNEGLADACDLVDCLLQVNGDDDGEPFNLKKQLTLYETLMHKRMFESANDSMEAKEIVHNINAKYLLVDRLLGNLKYFKSITPYFINTINYFSDFFGYSNK